MNFNAKQFGCFIILLKHSCGNMMISSLGSKGVDGFLSPYCNRVKESIPRTTRNFPFVGSGFILFSTLCNRPHRMTHKTSSPSTSIPVSSADCWPPALPKKFGNASMTRLVVLFSSSSLSLSRYELSVSATTDDVSSFWRFLKRSRLFLRSKEVRRGEVHILLVFLGVKQYGHSSKIYIYSYL